MSVPCIGLPQPTGHVGSFTAAVADDIVGLALGYTVRLDVVV